MIKCTLHIKHLLLLLLLMLSAAACRKDNVSHADTAVERVNIQVAADGVYAVNRQALTQAGLDISEWDYNDLNLSQGGMAVPFTLRDDTLVFYGQAPNSRYTNIRPYILATGKKGTAIETSTAQPGPDSALENVPQSIHLEENLLYTAEARVDENSEIWFWQELVQGDQLSLLVEIPEIADLPAAMRLHLWGYTHNAEIENDHDFDVIINGITIGTVQWDGQVYHEAELAIPAGVLKSGANNIILDNSAAGATFLDIMQLDWVKIDYTAPATAVDGRLEFSANASNYTLTGFDSNSFILNVVDPINPTILTDWENEKDQITLQTNTNDHVIASTLNGFAQPVTITPMLESKWQAESNQADMLIVTTAELAPALDPLKAAREEQGLSVAIVTAEEIYDEFGFGENSPESIQKFVAYAYENWAEPAPRYLFLVGDATFDYLGNLGDLPQNHIPSLLVPVQYSGETVSDSRLADVNDDMLPDLAVGRWPVSTISQVEDLVKRTLAYETSTANQRAIFATDDTEAQFENVAARLAEQANIPTEQFVVFNGATADSVTQEINNGAWLTTYIGHGSISQWGKNDVFTMEAVPNLNTTTPPIVLQLTCLTGLFSHPEQTSLTEAMLTTPNGPVILIAATSLTLSNNQETFANAFLNALQDPATARIGDAFQTGKLTLDVNNAGLREIADTFSLFADPSTRIVRP